VLPALKGQADARETMRDLLSRVDFHIIGDLGTPGGMIIRMGGIHSDPDNAERLVEMAVSPGNREVRLTAIGKWFRDNQAEVMRDIRQQFGDG
jgi:hypothetical protein